MSHRYRVVALSVFFLVLALPMFAVSPLPYCQEDSNSETNGSVYLICPSANPNADLVIFAHGFVDPSKPVGIPYDQLVLPDGTSIPGLVLQLGMSFAAPSYPTNGLAIVEGVADVKNLATYFKNHYGQPNRVFLTGVSEGGLVTAKAVESAPDVFRGGVAACGPVGDFNYQISYFMDVRVVFDYFFKDVLPGSPISIPDDLRLNFNSCTTATCTQPYADKIRAALLADPAKAAQLIKVTHVPTGPDPQQSVIDVLWYNAVETNDAFQKLGGSPYDNRFHWYSGSSNDLQLNLSVQRFKADSAAVQAVSAGYQTTGKVSVPLVTLHTTGDNVVPFPHEILYTTKVALNGSLNNFVPIPISRYGHCQFTPVEAVIGLWIMLLKAQ